MTFHRRWRPTGSAALGAATAGCLLPERPRYGRNMADSAEAAPLGQVEALVLETYGLPLLAYLCDTDEPRIQHRLEGAQSLTPEAETVLTHELVPLAQYVASQIAAQPERPRSFSLDILSRPTLDGRMSIGTALRRASGGVVPDELTSSVAGDPVKSELTRMAIDAFPLFLAPADPVWPMPRVSFFQHPSRANLQAAVQADGILQRMFTDDDQGLGNCGYIFTSLGRGGGVQDVMFGEMVIWSAWHVVSMTTQNPNLTDLIDQVHRNIDTLRGAISGGQPTIHARVVFTGFTTQDGQPIQTPWGFLRPLRDWERDLAPKALKGAVSGTSEDGSQVTVSYAGEMVLETELPYGILITKTPDPSDNLAQWPKIKGANELQRRIEAVQLAVLLATGPPSGSWVTAKVAWIWRGDPFAHGADIAWSDVGSMNGFMPAELSLDKCDRVREWAERIESHLTARIDISVRRLLSAAHERTDMADRLVDSVIVWENLFGTSQGEPRLRISAAMAWLLADRDDHKPREALQLELKNLYDYRSKIVHGGRTDDLDLAQSATAALTYSRDALRALLRDRTDVLALPDGAARSLRMIMGG